VKAAAQALAAAPPGSRDANEIRARFEGPVRRACLQALYVPPGSNGGALAQLAGAARASAAAWLPGWFPRLGVVLGMAAVLPGSLAPGSGGNAGLAGADAAKAAAAAEAAAEQQLQRASGALANRDLAAAVRAAQAVAAPRAAAALQDWCRDASAALAADQAAALLLVHASVLNSRLS
jgi:hypothetical protein